MSGYIPEYFVLNDDNSVSAVPTIEDWAKAYESRRHVAKTELGEGALVSTVFLGLNHAHDDGPPLLFETMVFQSERSDWSDLLCWRYSTWDQAEAGHARAVALVESYLAEGRSLSDLPYSDENEA